MHPLAVWKRRKSIVNGSKLVEETTQLSVRGIGKEGGRRKVGRTQCQWRENKISVNAKDFKPFSWDKIASHKTCLLSQWKLKVVYFCYFAKTVIYLFHWVCCFLSKRLQNCSVFFFIQCIGIHFKQWVDLFICLCCMSCWFGCLAPWDTSRLIMLQ